MARAWLVLMLTAALMACPFRCMGGKHVERGVAEQSGCPCCQHSCPARPDAVDGHFPHDAPLPERPDSACSDCICAGAVLSEADVLQRMADVPDGVAGITVPPSLEYGRLESRCGEAAGPPGLCRPSRAVRMAMCS